MTHYALLGGGRLARHFHHYFSLLNLPCSGWARDRASPLNSQAHSSAADRLRASVQGASHVLLLVSDSAIGELLRTYPFLHEKVLVHCSGALGLPGVAGAHPLMTFSHDLYDLAHYERIPFMVDRGHRFEEILPGLPNPHFAVSLEDKPLYHALCVAAGNFSQLLWQAAGERFSRLGLPAETLHPYLAQSLKNFIAHPETALTGPLSRGDGKTIERNLQSLEGDALGGVYRAFVTLYEASQREQTIQEVAL